jgi:membrane protease subunit HflK
MNELQDHPELQRTRRPAEPAEVLPGPETPDDPGSQALSDALRSSFKIIQVVMVGLAIMFLFSGFFTVGTQEKAVILRFGKPVGQGERALLEPGIHWAFPYPIDEYVKISVGQLQTVSSSIGWYATSAAAEAGGGEPPPAPALNPALDGYVLTGDENIIHVRGSLLYRITAPGLRYTFDFTNTPAQVQNAFDNALLYAAAGFKVDDALTRDVAGFRDRVRARLNDLVAQYQLGITVDQINLQAIPPRQLTTAFAAVLEADVRRGKVLNDARSYENQTVSRARSEAQARINAGETERNVLVKSVNAEAARFTAFLPKYKANPERFVEQRQLEVLQRVLTNIVDPIILPRRSDGKLHEIRLQLGQDQRPLPKLPDAPKDEH